ncbi:MAG: outer membrane protein transport protein [Thermodesulfobacteriota bacterium]|nr:outer membrane protein transport protein [Thermodesulfobacteriota bacterium]
MLRRQSWRAIPWLTILGLSLSCLAPDPSVAGGPVHGTKAASMGAAFVAVADDPSAIMHNTAGLTQLPGTHLYTGATAVIPSSEYLSPDGESEKTDFQVFFPPHLYVSSDFGMEDVALGLGIYSPFGIGGRKWDDKGLTRYASVESMITTMSVNPTVAWRLLPNVSVGLGVDYMWSFNEAERMLDQSSAGAGDGKLSLDADGGGWGYNLGVLLFPEGKFSVGAAYRSEIEIDQSGSITLKNIAEALQPAFGGSRFKTDMDTTLDFPQMVNFAVAYRPTTRFTLGLELEWTGWSSFDKQVVDIKDEVPEAGFSDSTTPLDWKDMWRVGVGMEYKANENLALRGGYTFMENQVPEHTLGPASPESDQHVFSIGFGYKMNKTTLDAFYMVSFYEDRKVDNAILSGEYENFAHYIGFSWGYSF